MRKQNIKRKMMEYWHKILGVAMQAQQRRCEGELRQARHKCLENVESKV